MRLCRCSAALAALISLSYMARGCCFRISVLSTLRTRHSFCQSSMLKSTRDSLCIGWCSSPSSSSRLFAADASGASFALGLGVAFCSFFGGRCCGWRCAGACARSRALCDSSRSAASRTSLGVSGRGNPPGGCFLRGGRRTAAAAPDERLALCTAGRSPPPLADESPRSVAIARAMLASFCAHAHACIHYSCAAPAAHTRQTGLAQLHAPGGASRGERPRKSPWRRNRRCRHSRCRQYRRVTAPGPRPAPAALESFAP